MQKLIKTVDEARGIVQVTTVDERWYARPVENQVTGLPAYEYVPSVTWITKHYPKGIGYMKWLAGLGWNEAEAVSQAAREKGSRVHQGIDRLLDGQTVQMGDVFVSPHDEPAELSAEEYEAILSFADWWQSLERPVCVAKEFVVWGDGYAGTVDLLARLDGRLTLIDFKSSQDVWPEHEIQVTAYRDALPPELLSWQDHPVGEGGMLIAHTPESLRAAVDLAIIQVGYRKNQRGWKLTPVEYQPELFAATRAIWAKETAGQRPIRKDYPLSINLKTPVPEKPRAKRRGRTDAA